MVLHRKFRLKWPWEQDRQMAVYNRSSAVIQVASQPGRPHMQTRAGYVDGWCLSHLPGSGCFISHYCANAHSKQVTNPNPSPSTTLTLESPKPHSEQVMKELYALTTVPAEERAHIDTSESSIYIHYLAFP